MADKHVKVDLVFSRPKHGGIAAAACIGLHSIGPGRAHMRTCGNGRHPFNASLAASSALEDLATAIQDRRYRRNPGW